MTEIPKPLKLEGIRAEGNNWIVSFTWTVANHVWIRTEIPVPRTIRDEDIVRVARAHFHGISQFAAENTAAWQIDKDVIKELEKGGN